MAAPLLRDDAPAIDSPIPGRPDAPLTDYEKMRYDRVAIRDELGEAQASATAARRLSAQHLSRLMYSLEYGPDAVERHTAPYVTRRSADLSS